MGYTLLLTVCCFQNAAYTMLALSMNFTRDAHDFAKKHGVTTSKKTPKLSKTMWHIKFVRLYFFMLWAFNTASTYLLLTAYEYSARPVAAVFVALHAGVVLIDWDAHAVIVHALLGAAFLLGGLLAKT